MSASAGLHRAVFDQVHALSRSWLSKLLFSRREDIRGVLSDRARMVGLAAWWHQKAEELVRRGCPALTGSESLVEGLDDPGRHPEDWIDRGLFGAHFLVRVGDTQNYRYFAPPPESGAGQERMTPYRSALAIRGVTLDGQRGMGLEDIRVPLPSGIEVAPGSPLSLGHGVAQYVPDFQELQGRIPFGDIDLLTRNRSSIYLPLPRKSDGHPDALLIVQSAIPRCFGYQWLLERTVARVTSAKVDPGFFQALREGLFGVSSAQEEPERLARVLRETAGMSIAVEREVSRAIQSRSGHVQRTSWPFVRGVWSRRVQQQTDPEARLATVLLYHLALPAILGDEGRMQDEALERETDLTSLPHLLITQRDRFPGLGLHRATLRRADPCDHVERNVVATAEPFVALALLEMLHNARKHVGRDVDVLAGCGTCFAEHFEAEGTMLAPGGGSFVPVSIRDRLKGTLVVGVLDSADLPPARQLPERNGGMRQMEMLRRAIDPDDQGPALFAFAAVKEGDTLCGPKNLRKAAMFVFPEAR